MTPLFACCACGAISTLGSSYEQVEGILVCKPCAAQYQQKRQPAADWVKQAIDTQAAGIPVRRVEG